MVWMTAWSHWSWLVVLVETWTSGAPQGSIRVRVVADTVQHLYCDTDSECKCGLIGTCLYLGSLRKSLSNRSDTVSKCPVTHSIGAEESLRKLAYLALGAVPRWGPADMRCDYTEVLN